MDMQLRGRRAFVSGSTQGIGYAIARALLEEGVSVVINGRTERSVETAVRKLESEVRGASVSGLAADFGESTDIQHLLASLGSIDILVNNVGLFEVKSFTEISDEDWVHYVNINLMSSVRLSRSLLPAMVGAGWGRIIFISNESGVNIPADMTHYGVTKAGQIALGNGLAKLTRGTGVTVNTILGGPTYSDGVARTVEQIARTQQLPVSELKTAIIGANQTSLLERFTEPEEIANLAVFQASVRSSATNGAAVRADGGVLTSLL
ncbi:SDR family NAD(P)-dependent oxidoreductase [Vibrio cholerae]|nr:SDR family NAD(P)-dependent oxidoreductase [Vibrio cholerae]